MCSTEEEVRMRILAKAALIVVFVISSLLLLAMVPEDFFEKLAGEAVDALARGFHLILIS